MRRRRTIYFNDARHYYLYAFEPPMKLEDAWRPIDEMRWPAPPLTRSSTASQAADSSTPLRSDNNGVEIKVHSRMLGVRGRICRA